MNLNIYSGEEIGVFWFYLLLLVKFDLLKLFGKEVGENGCKTLDSEKVYRFADKRYQSSAYLLTNIVWYISVLLSILATPERGEKLVRDTICESL